MCPGIVDAAMNEVHSRLWIFLREFSPEMQDCESLFTDLEEQKMVAEKYPVRHFLRIQQVLEQGELDNVYWPPGSENPADGLTKVKGEMIPLHRFPESGAVDPGISRPLNGVSSNEEAE